MTVKTLNGNGIKVVHNGHADPTDIVLQVEAKTHETYEDWDREKIVLSICEETSLSEKTARDIAGIVEGKLEESRLEVVSTDTIRELVDGELVSRGYGKALRQYAPLSIPFESLKSLLFGANKENSNQTMNPESINLSIAETIFKEYALREIFAGGVADAHRRGDIHVHDLGFAPLRPYCGGHSLEYVKKYGLKLPNITSTSKPARHAAVLVGHMVKMASTLQSFYAGAVGWDAVNIFFSPFFRGFSYREIKQIAQMLIFEFNQLAGARGSQVVFTDFNLYGMVPDHFSETPAMGPGGMYCYEILDPVAGTNSGYRRMTVLGEKPNDPTPSNKFFGYRGQEPFPKEEVKSWGEHIKQLTYKDFEREAQLFLRALFDVYTEGDATGQTFFFPKPLLHISEGCLENEGCRELITLACEVASKQGITYFVFDRGEEVTVSQCCRLKLKLNEQDLSETVTPERMRFTALQNVTLNLPRVAYRICGEMGRKDWKKLLPDIDAELERLMGLVVQAHKAKKRHIKKLFSLGREGPLSLFVLDHDGRPYLQMEKMTYLAGVLGLNEMVQFICGEEMHESTTAYELGLRVIIRLQALASEMGKQAGIHLVLEESPAESACYRLATLDLKEYPEQTQVVIKGDLEHSEYYYTNSVHYSYAADIDYIQRVIGQSAFHPLIEAGAIVHVWLGEQEPDPASLENFVLKVLHKTECTQLAFSPEFTVCEDCHRSSRGLYDQCPRCGSDDIYNITRIVGYFSRVQNWNKAKIGELKDRKRGLR